MTVLTRIDLGGTKLSARFVVVVRVQFQLVVEESCWYRQCNYGRRGHIEARHLVRRFCISIGSMKVAGGGIAGVEDTYKPAGPTAAAYRILDSERPAVL